MDAAPAAPPSPWPRRRRRAEELRARYPFAAEVLTLYLALLDVQEEAAEAADRAESVSWAASELVPRIVAVTVAAGPHFLGEAAAARLHGGGMEGVLWAWMRSASQDLVDRYLSRATMAPLLEVLPSLRTLCARSEGSDAERTCPACGGPPQLSWLEASGEALVAGRRNLLCARCYDSWSVPRAACAGCGGVLTIHAERTAEPAIGERPAEQLEGAVFPHLRVEGCERCHRYLIGVDQARDTQAVPEVDELAAIPLDLYAAERGLEKVTRNLVGM